MGGNTGSVLARMGLNLDGCGWFGTNRIPPKTELFGGRFPGVGDRRRYRDRRTDHHGRLFILRNNWDVNRHVVLNERSAIALSGSEFMRAIDTKLKIMANFVRFKEHR